ncbi:hypothetical protein ABIB06_004452 [Bradyrhizobium sp. LB8.2]
MRFGLFWIARASPVALDGGYLDCGQDGCMPQTLHDRVKNAEVDSGQRAGVPTEMAEKLKALDGRTARLGRPTRSTAGP